MKNFIKKNRERISNDMQDIQTLKYFSPALYLFTKSFMKAIDQFVSGRLIDVGCGHMVYRKELKRKADAYESIDIEPRTDGVNYVGSVLDMHMIKDDQYDTAVCMAVLEHVPDPFKAVREIQRILKVDGILLVGVPHMSRLHELPNDYFRYTEFGLKTILEREGFEVVHMEKNGTLLSFLGHQLSTAVLCLFWGIPIIKHVVFFLNRILLVYPIAWFDQFFSKSSLMPLNYFCVAKKINKS